MQKPVSQPLFPLPCPLIFVFDPLSFVACIASRLCRLPLLSPPSPSYCPMPRATYALLSLVCHLSLVALLECVLSHLASYLCRRASGVYTATSLLSPFYSRYSLSLVPLNFPRWPVASLSSVALLSSLTSLVSPLSIAVRVYLSQCILCHRNTILPVSIVSTQLSRPNLTAHSEA